MNRLKDIWGGQDDMNRVLLLIAVAVFAWSLIEGHGMYGALLAVVVLFLMVSRHGQRIKRFSRLYGTLYFPMPDGELVPRTSTAPRAAMPAARWSCASPGGI